MRRTVTLQRVARVLLAEVAEPHWGYELAAKAGVNHAAVYPMLAKLAARGYLVPLPVVVDGTHAPRRRYRVTSSGRDFLAVAAQGPTGRSSRGRQRPALPVVEAVRQGRVSLAGGVFTAGTAR